MARKGRPSISRRRRGSKRADEGVLRGSGQSPVVGAVVLDVVLCRPPQTQRNAAQRSAAQSNRSVAASQSRSRSVAEGGWRLSGCRADREKAKRSLGFARGRDGGSRQRGSQAAPLIGSSLGVAPGQKHRCRMPKTPNRSQKENTTLVLEELQLGTRKSTSRKGSNQDQTGKMK